MKSWGKWGGLTLAAGGLLVLAGRFVISQQPGFVQPPPNFSALFERVKPAVEEALGGKLDFMPQFRAVSSAQLATTPDLDLDAHLRHRFPHLQGEILTRTRQGSRQIVSSADVARYVEGNGIIIVAPENLPKIAAWDEALAPVNSEAFLHLALVQEIIRWDIDRRFSLSALRGRCRDAEEWDALHAIIEGQVQAATHQVATRLGNAELFPLLAARYLRVPDNAADASFRAVSQTALHTRFHASVQGKSFHDAVVAAGVPNAASQVFERLPRQMTVIARPDLWLEATRQRRIELVALLKELDNTLPAADWHPAQQTWTPAMLIQVAEMLGAPKARAEKVSQSWYEGRTLVWTNRKRPDRNVALSVVRHASETGARSYFGFAIDLQRKHDTLPPDTCGPMVRVMESKSSAVREDGLDEMVRIDKLISIGEMPAMPVSVWLARAGNMVIECTWHGQTADEVVSRRLCSVVRLKGN